MNGLEAFYYVRNEIVDYDKTLFEDLFLKIEEDLTHYYQIVEYWKKFDFKNNDEKTIKEKLIDIPISAIGSKYSNMLRVGKNRVISLKTRYPSTNFYELYCNRKNIYKIYRMNKNIYLDICNIFKNITMLDIYDDEVESFF